MRVENCFGRSVWNQKLSNFVFSQVIWSFGYAYSGSMGMGGSSSYSEASQKPDIMTKSLVGKAKVLSFDFKHFCQSNFINKLTNNFLLKIVNENCFGRSVWNQKLSTFAFPTSDLVIMLGFWLALTIGTTTPHSHRPTISITKWPNHLWKKQSCSVFDFKHFCQSNFHSQFLIKNCLLICW